MGDAEAFWYEVQTLSCERSLIWCRLLRAYGLNVTWRATGCADLKDAVRIRIGGRRDSSEPQEIDDRSSEYLLAETLITANRGLLGQFGLSVTEVNTTIRDLPVYLMAIPPASSDEVSIGMPLPLRYTQPFCTDGGWQELWVVFGVGGGTKTICARRRLDGVCTTVIAVDFEGYLDRAMLGPTVGPASGQGWDDWSLAYASCVRQSQMRKGNTHELLELLKQCVVSACWRALPVSLHYYPEGHSAPLLITGDTDDASPAQLEQYCDVVKAHDAGASILMKSYEKYPHSLVVDLMNRGHCFGIHPYVERGGPARFRAAYRMLCEQHRAICGGSIWGVRNHRYQYLQRQLGVELATEQGVTFELNCVAGSGDTWVGSASGSAIPLPFMTEASECGPYHLPTVVEDDVFLFDHDYCYKALVHGDRPGLPLVLDYLQKWVCGLGYPATLNLHPEHIAPQTRGFLLSILEWAKQNRLWMPTLQEYATWLRGRDLGRWQVHARGGEIAVKTMVPCWRGVLRVHDDRGRPASGGSTIATPPRGECFNIQRPKDD